MALLVVPAILSPITKKQITSFTSVLIALSITATATHQIFIILALPINMPTITILAAFSFIQISTLACTFYKGLNKIISKVKKTWKRIKREQIQQAQQEVPLEPGTPLRGNKTERSGTMDSEGIKEVRVITPNKNERGNPQRKANNNLKGSNLIFPSLPSSDARPSFPLSFEQWTVVADGRSNALVHTTPNNS